MLTSWPTFLEVRKIVRIGSPNRPRTFDGHLPAPDSSPIEIGKWEIIDRQQQSIAPLQEPFDPELERPFWPFAASGKGSATRYTTSLRSESPPSQ
jgi:hypothetical protein